MVVTLHWLGLHGRVHICAFCDSHLEQYLPVRQSSRAIPAGQGSD